MGWPKQFCQTNPLPIFVSLGVHSWFTRKLRNEANFRKKGEREKGERRHRRFLRNEANALCAPAQSSGFKGRKLRNEANSTPEIPKLETAFKIYQTKPFQKGAK